MPLGSSSKKNHRSTTNKPNKTQRKFSIGIFFSFLILVGIGYGLVSQKSRVPALAATSLTVCPLGCDYTNLTAAAADAGGAPYIITIKDDFIFDDTLEDDDIFLQTETTIQCEPGAVFGDSAQDDATIWPDDNNTIQDCTFENVSFDTTFGNTVHFYDNDFSSTSQTAITLTGTDGFEITGNTGLQHLQIQAPSNGLIDDNEFECRFNTNCIGLFNDTPENIVISNNTFTNHNVTSGDMIDVQKGANIDITGNTFQSVQLNDVLIRTLRIRTDDVYVANNYFIQAERTTNPGSSAWAIEVNPDGVAMAVDLQHNTFVANFPESSNSNDAAIGLTDNGSFSNLPVEITAEYNLYYQAFDTTPITRGIDLEYTIGSADLTLNNSFNGFFGVANLVYDSTGTITTLDSSTLTSDPLLRTENLDTDDDYYPSPISRYLDADGGTDIGAYSDSRVSTYLIDDDCVVDYATCFSNTSYTLRHAVSSGDDVTIAEGSYTALTLDFPASGVSFSGAGATTIFDAGGSGSALRIENIDASDFADFETTNSAAAVTESYEISRILFDFGGESYDDSLPVTGSADTALIFTDDSCGVTLLAADDTDVTAAVGAATDDWNVGLIETSGFKLTILFPDRFISSSSELADYALNECGATATIDLFIPSVFTVSDGDYIYNAAGVTTAGASLTAGIVTDPPTLEHSIDSEEAAGLHLHNADSNTITGATSRDNSYALLISGTSEGNTVEDSLFEISSEADVFITGSGDNDLIETSFDRASSTIFGTGDTTVWYRVKAFVTSSGSPIENANVTFTSGDLGSTQTVQTDVTGNTPYTNALPAYVLTSSTISETSGGYNPYSAFIDASSYSNKLTSFTLNEVQQILSVDLSKQSGGGGALQFPGDFMLSTTPNQCAPSSNITVNVSGNAFSFVALSNDPEFTATSWQAFNGPSDHYAWDLGTGDGKKTIYARVRSNFGNVSNVQTTSVLLDTENGCLDFVESPTTPEEETEPLVAGEGQAVINPGAVLKALQDTVYYYGNDGKRHVFPDTGTYFSWFKSFNPVWHVTQAALNMLPLGKNVTYKPGSLIKFRSPAVFLVGELATLHHILNEETAVNVFGTGWAAQVHDVDDVFAPNYTEGDKITAQEDAGLDRLAEIETIDQADGFTGNAKPFVADEQLVEEKQPSTKTTVPATCPMILLTKHLSIGATDAEVAKLQQSLKCLGYFPASQTITTYFGPITQSAVQAFQRVNKLPATGILDTQTRTVLLESLQS